jgi:large subunit ribosomal protein L10
MRTDQARDVERQRKDFPASDVRAIARNHSRRRRVLTHCHHAAPDTPQAAGPLPPRSPPDDNAPRADSRRGLCLGDGHTSARHFTGRAPCRTHCPVPTHAAAFAHRQYQSLLKSSPLMLIFQHNNVKADEWMGIRRELAIALRKLDAERAQAGHEAMSDEVRIQVIQTNIFASALKIVEFFNPEQDALDQAQHPTDARTPTSARVPLTGNKVDDERFTHGLSRHAYQVANNRKLKHDLEPLLAGPLAVVAFPSVSPQHLKAVLSILSPSAPDFPAPKRKANPDYYEPAVQAGLQKLMLLGARVEGKVFDVAGTKWVGSIPGGIDGLRAQLVQMLQGVGGSLTGALEGASKSLYFTMESRRMDMEEKEKGPEEPKAE